MTKEKKIKYTVTLRSKDKADIFKELDKAVLDYSNARFDLSLGKLKDTSRLGKLKKKVSRIRTVIKEKEILSATV